MNIVRIIVDSDGASGEPAPAPILNFVFTADVTLAPPVDYGSVDGKHTRFIGITGGTVSGPRLHGVVLPGGGDYQSIGADGVSVLHARYSLRADDGTIIAVENRGIRVASPAVSERLAQGERVDPSLYYFRTTPTFAVADGEHGWLRRSVFVARAVRAPDSVRIDFYAVG